MKKSIKQMLSVVLVIAMMATLLVAPAAAADKPTIDVYDFGAEQLDATKYNNMLTEAEINGWYPEGTAVGVDNVTFPSFTTTDGTLSYDNNGATNHRLRTSNKNLTRYDTRDIKDADGNVFKGYVYSNSAKEPLVKMTLHKLVAGDKVTYAVSSNGGDSTIQFEGPNGVEGEKGYAAGAAQVQFLTFYPQADGAYSVCSLDEKLCVARIYVEHPATVTVSGSVTAPADMTGLKLVFTNTVTGIATEAAVADGKYTVALADYQDGATYNVATAGATGAVVSSGEALALAAGDTTKTHDVVVEKVKTKIVSGTVTGLGAEQLAKLELSMVQPAGKLLVPEIALDRSTGAWSTELEPDVTYTVVAKKVNDYSLTAATATYAGDADVTDATIAFAAKPTYAITITPDGVDAADLADAEVTFTLLNEGGDNEDELLVPYNVKNVYHYVYTFTGIDNIQLRDGTYDVKVETAAGKQKVTSNLVVNGAAAPKVVKFIPAAAYVAPGNYDLTSGMSVGDVPRIDGVKFSGLSYHNEHGLIGQNGSTITLSLEAPANITLGGCQYSAKEPEGAENKFVAPTSDKGTVAVDESGTDPSYTVAGVEGDVVITLNGTFYLHSIKVESAAPATVAADTYDFTTLGLGQGDPVTVAGIDFGSFKFWNSHGLHGSGAIKLNMADAGVITVTTCAYGNGADATTSAGTLTGADGTESDGNTPETLNKILTIADVPAGEVTLTIPSTTYIHSIKVEYPTFEIVPAKWNFMNGSLEEHQIQSKAEVWEYLSIDATTGKFNCRSTNWAQFNNTTKITVPIYGAVAEGTELEVVVENYDTNYEINGTPATAETTTYTVTVDTDHSFTVTATADSYIGSIEVKYPDGTFPEPPEDVVLQVGPDKEYKTVNAAVAAAAAVTREPGQRITIEIDPGNYEEEVAIKVKDLTLKNAKADQAKLELKNKGVDIGENEVRITWYYGHGYNYYSMTDGSHYDADVLEVNKENGYASYANPGGKVDNQTYWNSTVSVSASGFAAEGIIFENSFNQYVSAASVKDVIVSTNSSTEPKDAPRGGLKTVGDTCVQDASYVERAAALGIGNNMGNATFDHCAFIGRQDVVFGGVGVKAAFYDCDIYGGTDYIMGPMTAVVAKSNLVLNTSEGKNDVAHITAAQNGTSGSDPNANGYLMYNCTVKSTVPGVNTASAKVSKPSDFGRPWSGENAEAVFYKTIIEATDPSYVTAENPSFSLIQPIGWCFGLGGSSKKCLEVGTMEWYEYEDNSADRDERFGGVMAEEGAVSPINKIALNANAPAAWLGAEFNAFWADKDLTIEEHTPVAVDPIVFEVAIDGEKTLAMTEGDTAELTAAVSAAPRKAPVTVTWTSGDATVATVDAAGKVTAVKAGTATLTATAGTATATVDVTVTAKDAPVSKDALEAAIAAAEAVYNVADDTYTIVADTVVASGVTKGEKFLNEKDVKALADAIEAAKAVLNDPEATQADVAKAVAALDKAVADFYAAVKTGTKGNGGGTPSHSGGGSVGTTGTTTTTTTNANGDTVKKTTDRDGKVTYTVTSKDGEVLATVELPATISTSAKKFKDVPDDHWAANSINDLAALGMVKGVADEIYDMVSPVTRGSLATILFRLAQGKEGIANNFSDVIAGTWYTDAVGWAAKTGVVTGFEDGAFRPDDSITREQLVVMLYRFAKLLALDTSAEGKLDSFTDSANVGDWAKEAMEWAVGAGIVKGDNLKALNPTAAASRAETACMVDRFLGLMK